jgi:hypothetical protein
MIFGYSEASPPCLARGNYSFLKMIIKKQAPDKGRLFF